MTQQIINIGNAPDDGTGDQLRISFDKCNGNFTELYQGVAANVPLGNAIEYQFNNSTTEPPASGQIRLNQATQAATTKLWVSHTAASGINIKQFLSAATTGSKLILQDKNDNTNYLKLDVTGAPVDKTTYWEFPVAVTASGGALPNARILAAVTAAVGGGGAPLGAEYITSTADATLTAERVLTDTATVTWDRTTTGQIKANVASSAITTVAIQKFITSGTYTPTAGMKYCIIEAVGGGGGGGGATAASGQAFSGGGGGAGSYSRALKTATQVGASQSVTIGAFGSGASGAVNGNAGGDTTVGALCIAKAGQGGGVGNVGTVGAAGAGGIAGTGDIASAGAPGIGGLYSTTSGVTQGSFAAGGSSIYGGGAPPANITGAVNNGIAAGPYGSGGSGGISNTTASASNGGNGSAGIVIITEYI